MISSLIGRSPPFFAPVALGIITFFLVIGPGVLDPTNIAWLSGGGDTTQHYLGWAFYRHGPWTIPLGLNPQFGLEISSSIVFSDSIPLMAFLFKPFSFWLPEPFQYLGIWMLICFILQAYFAWLLIGLFSSNRAIKILGSALIVFAPPMLFRLELHIPLASHFVVLAALYLAIRNTQQHRIIWWTLLIGASVLINFYLLVMVALIWITGLIDCALVHKKINHKSFGLELLIVSLTLGILFWQAGYLALDSTSAAWGLGFYRMNVLSIFNPMGWSYLIDELYKNPVRGEYEGFNYLGLGFIALLLITLFQLPKRQQWLLSRWRYRPVLCICLLALIFLAISHQIGVGPLNADIFLPDRMLNLLSTLRSSGRLFWPVWYVLALLVIYTVVKSFSHKAAIVILSSALFFQVADTSAKWWPRRVHLNNTTGSDLLTSLKNPFWSQAGNQYSQVLRRTLSENPADWNILAQYASTHKIGTDSVYLARIDSKKIELVNEQFKETLSHGSWDSKTLYAIDNTLVLPVLAKLDPDFDLFARIDNQNILAPRWYQCPACPVIDKKLLVEYQIPKFKIGEKISFTNADPKNDFILTKGWWTWPDIWGTWSLGKVAQVNVALPRGNVKQFTFYVRALISPDYPVQRVKVTVNGQFFQEFAFTAAEHNPITIPISAAINKQGYLAIKLEFLNAIQPKLLGMGQDDRELAIGIESARFD